MAEKTFIDRMNEDGEAFAPVFATNKACQSCMFAHGTYGNPPKEYNPGIDFCQIYDFDDDEGKPDDVSFEGATCEYYEEDK